jgi:hypothetical protein
LKHHFIDFTEVVFLDVQKAEWVLRDIRLLKISLQRLRPSPFLKSQYGENAFEWHFNIMKYRFIDII